MTNKQIILNAFDKAIENSKNSPEDSLPIAIGFIVCLTSKEVGELAIGLETVIVDEINMQRKRDYLAKKLDDDGFYIGTNKTVQVGTIFSDYMPIIGNAMREAISDFYSQTFEGVDESCY